MVVCSQCRVCCHRQHRADYLCSTHTRTNDVRQFCAVFLILEELDMLIYNTAFQLQRNIALRSIERSHVGTELHALHLEVKKPVACWFWFRLLTINKESTFRLFSCQYAILQREGIMIKSEYFYSLYLHVYNQFFHRTVFVVPKYKTVLIELLAEHILYLYLVVICHSQYRLFRLFSFFLGEQACLIAVDRLLHTILAMRLPSVFPLGIWQPCMLLPHQEY